MKLISTLALVAAASAQYAPAPVAVVKEVPQPYAYEYGVADDYSKANFRKTETLGRCRQRWRLLHNRPSRRPYPDDHLHRRSHQRLRRRGDLLRRGRLPSRPRWRIPW